MEYFIWHCCAQYFHFELFDFDFYDRLHCFRNVESLIFLVFDCHYVPQQNTKTYFIRLQMQRQHALRTLYLTPVTIPQDHTAGKFQNVKEQKRSIVLQYLAHCHMLHLKKTKGNLYFDVSSLHQGIKLNFSHRQNIYSNCTSILLTGFIHIFIIPTERICYQQKECAPNMKVNIVFPKNCAEYFQLLS